MWRVHSQLSEGSRADVLRSQDSDSVSTHFTRADRDTMNKHSAIKR